MNTGTLTTREIVLLAHAVKTYAGQATRDRGLIHDMRRLFEKVQQLHPELRSVNETFTPRVHLIRRPR